MSYDTIMLKTGPYAIGNQIQVVDDLDLGEYNYGNITLKIDTNYNQTYKRYHFIYEEREILQLTLSKENAQLKFPTLHIQHEAAYNAVSKLIKEKNLSIALVEGISPNLDNYQSAYGIASSKSCPAVELKLSEIVDYLAK